MKEAEQKDPQADPSVESPRTNVSVQPAGEAVVGSAIGTKMNDVHAQVESAGQVVAPDLVVSAQQPGEEIPDFDQRELYNDTVQFIERLKAAVPEERKAQVDSFEKYLKTVVIEIALEAEDLKTLNINLTPEQRALSQSAMEELPLEVRQTVIKEYGIQLRLLTGLLQQFKEEGVGMFVEAGKDGFTMNGKTIKKMMDLMNAMIESDKIVRKWKQFTPEESKHYEEVYGSVKETKPSFSGINWEDILDAKVDELMYKEILEALAMGTPAGILARKSLLAILVNFRHLKNSLAVQKNVVLSILMEDIANGLAANLDYYDDAKELGIFPGEAHTAAYLLAVLERSIRGILSSQKIAQLMGDRANPSSQESQAQSSLLNQTQE